MEDWDADAWDTATQGEFATYDETGVMEITFTSNKFRQAEKSDRFGRLPYEFEVIQNRKQVSFEIGSLRLMRELEKLLPLKGKTIQITRSGTGRGTDFEVEVVE